MRSLDCSATSGTDGSVAVPTVPGATLPAAEASGPAGGRPAADPPPVRRRRHLCALAGGESGMTTAEYAVGTVAACGFGGVLYKAVTSDQVAKLITDVIRRALTTTF